MVPAGTRAPTCRPSRSVRCTLIGGWKFLLRRGERFAGRAWTQPQAQWRLTRRFEDQPSRATLIDYCCAVEALVQRRKVLIGVLEQAVPDSSHAETIARLRCFRGIDTLSGAGLCAEVGSFERFAKPDPAGQTNAAP
jgi:transposase